MIYLLKMVILQFATLNNQRVNPIKLPVNPIKPPVNHHYQ